MAVTAINLARISNNWRAFNLLESLRSNQAGLYRVQNNLATGLRFLQPSEDPLRAASANSLDRRLAWMNQVQSNLSKVNATLNEVDTATQEALDLLSEAQSLAVQATGDTLSSEERQALATVADSLIDRLVTIGNRKHLNTYLFSGRQGDVPFERTGNGVIYRGDAGRMETMVDTDLSEDSFTVSGQEFFSAVSAGIQGVVDLDPAVTAQTRISDLHGALGRGVQLGRIQVATADGDHGDRSERGGDDRRPPGQAVRRAAGGRYSRAGHKRLCPGAARGRQQCHHHPRGWPGGARPPTWAWRAASRRVRGQARISIRA